MKVRDIMRRDVQTCAPDLDLRRAGQILGQIGVGVVPVVDAEHRIVGIFTDRDLCLGLVTRDAAPSKVEVSGILSAPVHTCHPEDSVRLALRGMREHGVRRLPVVDEDGRVQGILSLDDIVLATKTTGGADLDGPFYAEIAIALQKIVEHQFEEQAEGGISDVR